MNNDELTSHAIKIVIAVLTWVSARYLPPDVGASFSAYIPTVAAGAVALAAAGYGVYRHTNMKLVPEKATAIVLPATTAGAAPPPVGATVNLTPLQGAVKVVGSLLIGFIVISIITSSAMAQDQPRRAVAQPKQEPTPIVVAAATTPASTDKSVDVFPCLTPPLIDLRPACNGGAGVSTNPTQKTSIDLWNKIVGAATPDLAYAVAMATAAAKSAPSGITSAAGMRLACLQSIQALNTQSTGAALVDKDGKPLTRPNPSLFTDAETMMEILDAVQPGGPLWTSCAGAAQLAGTSVVAFINALLAGAAGVAALAPK